MIRQRTLFRIVAFAAMWTAPGLMNAAETTKSEPVAAPESTKLDKPHPLVPVIELATKELERANREIDEYSCLLIKRERVDGKLMQRQYMQTKIRQRKVMDDEVITPLSVYIKFLKPSSMKGREVLYVEGERDGDVLARKGGSRLPNITVELDPTGRWAMEGNLHPITEIGFGNLAFRLIENMREDLAYKDVDVKFYGQAKLGDRECQHIQVTHKTEQDYFDYHVARIFIDKEMRVPIYFASYGWPEEEGGEPVLNEEYMFTNIKINPGFTDKDFDASNPEYAFQIPDEKAALAAISK